MREHIHLNFVLRPHGSHPAAWREASASARDLLDIDYYRRLVQTAERGLFDTVFLTDTLAHSQLPSEALQWALDPVLAMTAVAGVTEHIGLIATHSTTFNAPFNTARAFASLDFISGGRAGWNVVTSTGDATARNFGESTLTEHDERYRRAADYLRAVIALWHGWAPDAVIDDKAAGRLVDPAKIRRVNYKGTDYATQGPLGLPRAPQTMPLISQAGASEAGRALGAEFADIIYAFHSDLDEARAYRADLHARARVLGRDPATLRLLPGIVPYVAETEAEALSKRRDLAALSAPSELLKLAASLFGIAFSEADLHRPLNMAQICEARGQWADPARAERALARPEAARGTLFDLLSLVDLRFQHKALTGTPEQIADYIEEGWRTGAFDGVSVIPASLPAGLDRFVDLVVPELQRRAIHKREYGSGPLRQRLGLREWQIDDSAFTAHYPEGV